DRPRRTRQRHAGIAPPRTFPALHRRRCSVRSAARHLSVPAQTRPCGRCADDLRPLSESVAQRLTRCGILRAHMSGEFVMGSKALGSEPQSSRVRPEFERIALLLQGGGALGSYQAGVYQALAEADLHPHWVAGISIGAINSALIAGNAKDQRVLRLREFWETVTQGPFGLPYLAPMEIKNDFVHQFINQGRAMGALLWGAPGFFKPRIPPPIFTPVSHPGHLSFYDVSPLKSL